MTIESRRITVGGVVVDVVRKEIKNLHLGVYPPNGRVRVAAPLLLSDEAVRLAVVDKLGWIKRQRAKFADQPRQSQRQMVNGESHYFLGRRYRLRVKVHDSSAKVALRGITTLEVLVRPGTTSEQREAILSRWHREQLRTLIRALINRWEPKLGVQVAAWGIKKMKTKWGSCNVDSRRLWFNLELAKKPPKCLEYIVVHELAHLLERHHNERFAALMSNFMPRWRELRRELNSGPLAHDTWTY